MCDAWDHRVLVIVILLPSIEIILVHFLLNIGHVAVGAEHLIFLDLTVKLLLVLIHLHHSIARLPLVKHAVENTSTLRLVCIILSLHSLSLHFIPLVIVYLVEQLSLVLVSGAILVFVGHLRTLV